MLDLDRLEQVAKAATPGEWKFQPPTANDECSIYVDKGWKVCKHYCTWKPGSNFHRGTAGEPGHECLRTDQVFGGVGYDNAELWCENADGEFVATFNPATVLELIAEVRRLRENLCEWEYRCTNDINTAPLTESPERHSERCSGMMERRRKAGRWLPVTEVEK